MPVVDLYEQYCLQKAYGRRKVTEIILKLSYLKLAGKKHDLTIEI